jgi:hypothetical protein
MQQLQRELGVSGATMMGLGSIVGTGIFASIGIAAGVAGPAVLLAIAVAALVATANGLSSAQLAASHPVSGGTYEYGYRYLNPRLGFTAGWVFLLAKSASAATAALGFAGYLLDALGVADPRWLTPLALTAVATLTGVVLAGIRRSNTTNIVIVSVTLSALRLGSRERLFPPLDRHRWAGGLPLSGLLGRNEHLADRFGVDWPGVGVATSSPPLFCSQVSGWTFQIGAHLVECTSSHGSSAGKTARLLFE